MGPAAQTLTGAMRDVETPLGRVKVRHRACPVCGTGSASARPTAYGTPSWPVLACGGCGFTYIADAPDYAAMSETLAWERSTKLEEKRRKKARPFSWRLSKATRFRLWLFPRKRAETMIARVAAPGNVIDLGCGDGAHLLALPAGYVPHGVEISAELARRAQETLAARGGTVIHAASIEGLRQFPKGHFSAALLRSYLEHEADPAGVMNALRHALKPGGAAVVKVPNFGSLNRRVMGANWCGFRYPDHLNYFTPASLRRLADACGFDCRFGLLDALPTDDNMWAVLTARA